jgi:hypothetical protein
MSIALFWSHCAVVVSFSPRGEQEKQEEDDDEEMEEDLSP